MQKANIKKIRLSPDFLLDWLSIDSTYNSLRWLYRSAKIAEQKNPFEYIFPPPTKVGRNNYLYTVRVYFKLQRVCIQNTYCLFNSLKLFLLQIFLAVSFFWKNLLNFDLYSLYWKFKLSCSSKQNKISV